MVSGLQATSPVTVMVPVAVMPAMMMPVMVMPVDLYGLDLVDFVLRHDGPLKICRRHGRRVDRNRRQGSSLRACRKGGGAQDQCSTETYKDPSRHDFMPFLESEKAGIVAASR
jgi:hypothetical protein